MKISNFYLQYGLIGLLKWVFYFFINPIYKNHKYNILVISKHLSKPEDPLVLKMTKNKISEWLKEGEIRDKESIRFNSFIENDCNGYYIEKENVLAAWGFIQTQGEYKYGEYLYKLPEKVHILKNLYVKPNFRGLSLGKQINEARINGIPNGVIPCGFVIPKNKYALRNLKMFGFEEYLSVSNVIWFKKWEKQRITILKSNNITDILMQGFNQNTTL